MGDTATIDQPAPATTAGTDNAQAAPAAQAPRDESGRFAGGAGAQPDASKTAQAEAQAKATEELDRKAFDAAYKGVRLKPGENLDPKGAEKPAKGAGDAGEEKPEGEAKAGETAPAEKPAPGDKPAAKPRAEATATPEDREKLVIAQRALRRDGWTEEEIGELKPGKVIEIGVRRALAQAKTDRRFEELRNGAGASPAGTRPTAPTDGDDDEETGERTPEEPAADLDELLEDVADPEAKKRAEAAVKSAKAAEARALKAEADATVRLAQGNISLAERQLAAEFPGLATEEGRRGVLKQMDRLDPGRTHALDPDALVQLMRDAAFIEFGPQLKAQARRQAVEANTRQRDGQPDTETNNARPQKRLTDDEADRAAFEAATATPDRNESRRLFLQKTGASVSR